jgi:hypothetical protein
MADRALVKDVRITSDISQGQLQLVAPPGIFSQSAYARLYGQPCDLVIIIPPTLGPYPAFPGDGYTAYVSRDQFSLLLTTDTK